MSHKMSSNLDVSKSVKQQVACLRKDHLRQLNPTTYKVSVSSSLQVFAASLWRV